METRDAPFVRPFFRMTVQEKIQQLLWDRRYVRVPEEMAPPGIDYLLIKDMTIADRNLYNFVRKRELEEARKQGVLTEAELMAEAKKIGLWTEEDDRILDKAAEHIEFLQSELSKQKFLARKKSIQLDIDRLTEKRQATQSKKNEYFINSADYYAAEVAASTLIRRVVCNLDGSLLFPNDTSFLLFKREHLGAVIFLTNEVLSEGVWPIDEVREVARNPEWRLTWSLQRENLSTIFNRTVGDLTLTQKLVIYWSRVYDSAFECAEPPTQEIVNDDDKFDEWLANRELSSKETMENKRIGVKDHQERMQILDGEYSDVCHCGAKAKNVGKGLGERVMHTGNCPHGTFRKYSREEREQIARQTYGRNSDRVRTLLDQEQQAVVEKGVLEEQHLRGKKSRHMLGMKTDVTTTKK